MKLSLSLSRTTSVPQSGSAARLLLSASLLLVPAACAHAQTTGVSNPPPNDTITADQDFPQQSPALTKPMPGEPTAYVPGTQSAAAAAEPAAAAATSSVQPSGQPSGQPAAAPVENPDFGIVTSTDDPAPTGTQTLDTGYSSKLISHPVNPGFGIVDMIPSGPNELAEGTDIHTRLLDPLSTTHTEEGQLFRAQIAQDVYKDGRVVIPVGSELRGRVVQVTQGHRLGSRATIRLRPDDILLPDGTAYHLYAEAVGTGQPGTRTDDEGGIQSAPHYAKDLTEYGAGAGGGAVVGSVFGGPVGAGAGAIVGAGMVTTHMLLQKPAQASLERGSEIVFSLTEPMQLLATKN